MLRPAARQGKPMNLPLRAGSALAVTAALGYTACTLVFLAWPEIATNFMNALFHGLEFRRLQGVPAQPDFGHFVYVLLILALVAFWCGALFGWLFERLGRAGTPGPAL